MTTLRSDSPIQYVKGVGPQRAEWLASVGIQTVGDLLEYFPFRHECESGEVDIADLVPGTNVTVRGEVVSVGGRRPTVRCEIDDGTGTCVLRWFHVPFGGLHLFRGATVVASGRVEVYGDLAELVQPRLQVFDRDAVLMTQPRGPRRVGVYRGNAQVKSPLVRRVVQSVLTQAHLPVDEVLPAELLHKHSFPTREQAVRQMHSPTTDAELERARRRLAYEELLLMELALALRRRKRLALQTGQKLYGTPEIDRRIRARFPFALTGSQEQVVREIVADLQSGRPMTRLLQGDVGSGKTVVALYACLVAIAGGRQAAIMAPTEILAQQHYTNIHRYLADSRVRYVLLRGKLGKSQRADALAAIERGEVDLVVGTQALIQQDVAFNQLALVIVDEQHKFGVLQRHQFRTKGPMPHYLVMTATPIPRTLAMTVFGDLDVSIIKQSPPGRGRITTKVVVGKQWETVMTYVRRRLEAGEQAYVVCPLIGEEGRRSRRSTNPPEALPDADVDELPAQTESLTSVIHAHEQLVTGPWQGLNVGLLHGALPTAEKQAVVTAFAAGKLHAVVATTVVEVGIDVPNATIMIVEHADRYGLSQLHQLRGRVGRGSQDSLCVLIAHDRGGKAAERLAVMTETTDGFKIAEADLRQRGPGQLFGTKQHGLPELRVASILDDFGLLEQARQDAFALAAADPTLARPEHQPLLPALKRMFGEKLALIDAA
jgi:ATP-dependent DNA helicase RecG